MTAAAARAGLGSRGDFSSLSDRMSYLLVLRLAMGAIIAAWAVLRPEALGVPLSTLGGWTAAYLVIAVVGEWARRRTTRFGYAILTTMLLVDGLYLACAMYATGGTQSPIRFVVYLQLVAVSLLASYRTGLKMALWDSLLAVRRPVRAGRPARPAGRRRPGRGHRVRPDAGPQRDLVLAVRDRDIDLLGPQRARAAPAPGGPPVARGRRRPPRRRGRRRPPVERRAGRPRRAVRLRARRPPRRVGRPGRRPGDPRLPGSTRRPRAIPTGSSGGPGSGTRSCRSSGSTPPATRSSPRSCPTPGTCSSRRCWPTGGRSARSSSSTAPGTGSASSGGSRRCSGSSPRSPRSTCAMPCCSSTSRTSPSATR